ncbi:hypothetical protein [Hydromonas duriensis]|uniref:Outer membrane protein TolC n=1 Tax=Hydromonas duriensis TaxID=1527608 RepID=A0A4R6Y7F8_9BURK|nr:hypothetical protein [Hydromonas duriensis]TDR31263.1 hypothetical protein DFR44_11126 [Hydromonas duriensis]
MNKILIAWLMLPFAASANEVDAYCRLTKVQANAQSLVLSAPKVFLSMGSTQSQDNVASMGISQSLSDKIQAKLIEKIADNKCKIYSTNQSIEDSLKFLNNKVLLSQIQAQTPLLIEALNLAEQNLYLEKKLFDSQNGTLRELTEAYRDRDDIRASISFNEQQRSVLQNTPNVDIQNNLKEQIAASEIAKSNIAYLTSKLNTTAGWDVIGSTGLKRELESGTNKAFVSLNMYWSLGEPKSSKAAALVEELTRDYLKQQYDSTGNAFLRLVHSTQGVLAAEKDINTSLMQQIQSNSEMLARVNTISTVEANRARNLLQIKQKVLRANWVASNVKLKELNEWLSINEVNK